ncbi:pentapeptide repeat-containing protein [Nonomuraea terrae]|uniref:Pentapeptide repeat-containing protein n=1 Tax=Nonomuraea terrae TaxID=2530383 RepID=A0A4R4XLX9_9ACTN|nr:pentapeptide repeat-containing protein [Nonomuraea terrae]TDD32198.1 pentapeptide repeat-containing protein [Nonomuraea terrae]
MPIALLVVGVIGGVAWWLLFKDNPGLTDARGRQGALQTALAAGAGVGAAVTLMLAFRRQRHQEHTAHVTAHLTERNTELAKRNADLADRNAALSEQVAEHNKHDATERRVTDLYTKAAEQLGHDKAAVRLAGLYALERLAQDNPDHRQTIVNVICAYLRMPYTPPTPVDPEEERKTALREARRRYHAARTYKGIAGTAAGPSPMSAEADPEGERQVRLTAQGILADHLRDRRPAEERDAAPEDSRFWPGMGIDLTGATLMEIDFEYCHPVAATFDGATFLGNAWFRWATFAGEASFARATFSRSAWFETATFSKSAWFRRVTFSGEASFREVTFSEQASFNGATFSEGASFAKATFSWHTAFAQATLSKANFAEAVVRASDADYIWPTGWHLETLPDGTGRLVRDDDGTAPGEPPPSA